jgi:hypothetical protein
MHVSKYFGFLLNRNLLFAFGVLPPAIYTFNGHAWLGLLFVACVVAGRFSVGPIIGRKFEDSRS